MINPYVNLRSDLDATAFSRPVRELKAVDAGWRSASERPPKMVRMRCACERCGAHTITNVGYAIAGNCSLCGSYLLKPLEPA